MMPINSDKLHLWKADIAQSIDFCKRGFRSIQEGRHFETRQYAMLKGWLIRHGYKQIVYDKVENLDVMPGGTFAFRPALTVREKKTPAKIIFDCIVKSLPDGKTIIIEAKSSDSVVRYQKR